METNITVPKEILKQLQKVVKRSQKANYYFLLVFAILVVTACGHPQDGAPSSQASEIYKCDTAVQLSPDGSISYYAGSFNKICKLNADKTPKPWNGLMQAHIEPTCGFWYIDSKLITFQNNELKFDLTEYGACQ